MNERQYNLGLVSVSFRDRSPADILAAMKDAGLTCIEWGSDVHAPCDNLENLQTLAALQAEYGITCCSYGTYFRFVENSIEELPRYIAAAKILGTDILRLWCGRKRRCDMTDEELAAFVDLCRQAAAIAEEAGVILCMECHRKTFTEDPDQAVWLMSQVNSPHFRMYWQPFQWQTPAQNVENAKTIAPYAEHIHVFNWVNKEKLPLAEAVADWQNYLRAFSGPRTLLLEFMPCGTIEELATEAVALRTITGGSL